MNSAKKLFIFDLDGTLIDSIHDLAYSINYTLRTMNLRECTTDEVRNAVGMGVSKLMLDLLPEGAKDRLQEALTHLLPHYNIHCSSQTHIYEGVHEYLEKLSSDTNIFVALLTNKPEIPTHIILRNLKMNDYFDLVIGGDTLSERKPQPTGILHAMEYFGVSKESTVMIGDSRPDIDAARAAGVRSVGICGGYGETDFIPDISISAFSDLADCQIFS